MDCIFISSSCNVKSLFPIVLAVVQQFPCVLSFAEVGPLSAHRPWVVHSSGPRSRECTSVVTSASLETNTDPCIRRVAAVEPAHSGFP